MKKILIKSTLILLFILNGCVIYKENPDLIIANVIEEVTKNPKNIYNIFEIFPNIKFQNRLYKFETDSSKIQYIESLIEKLNSINSIYFIRRSLDKSKELEQINKTYFEKFNISKESNILELIVSKYNSDISIEFLFISQDNQYFLIDIKYKEVLKY